MMKTKNLTYCRVSPVKGAWYRDRLSQLRVSVRVTIFLPDFRPNYAIGQHLRVETDKTSYLIYNPQKLAFNFNEFMSMFKTNLGVWDEKYISHSFEDDFRGK